MLGDVNGDGLQRLRGRHAVRRRRRRRLRHRLRLPRRAGALAAHARRAQRRRRLVHDHRPRRRAARVLRHRRRLQRRRPGRHRHRRAHGDGPQPGRRAASSTSSSARARRATSRPRSSTTRATRTTRRTRRRTRRSAAATRASSPTRTPARRVAAMPDVNGDGYEELADRHARRRTCTPGGGGAAVLYGKPSGRAHQPRRPVGGRVSVLLPRRPPDARQPARRRDASRACPT